jgi:hypothetical protein
MPASESGVSGGIGSAGDDLDIERRGYHLFHTPLIMEALHSIAFLTG